MQTIQALPHRGTTENLKWSTVAIMDKSDDMVVNDLDRCHEYRNVKLAMWPNTSANKNKFQRV